MVNNPYEILTPSTRWAPGQAQLDAYNNQYNMLMAPLVYKIRTAVETWRLNNYIGATQTSKYLLNYWFNKEHSNQNGTQFNVYSHKEAAYDRYADNEVYNKFGGDKNNYDTDPTSSYTKLNVEERLRYNFSGFTIWLKTTKDY
ncbi:MAG: hypothetical protein QM539_04095 [Alphaproteobacteria bacterium]|nr:hypothetical protein [Alphaproteobacteria bacterium]